MKEKLLFSNKELKNLIIPLFLEQLLLALVGIADVFIIGFVGESAVSGVSLVNSFNTIFINLFTALAAGGAVIISQYIGSRDKEKADQAASQLLLSSVLFSICITVIVLIWNENLMRLLFGKVEPEVMKACITYLKISAYSYPALAIYNSGAAVYRSFGKTSTTMKISVAANIINLTGNCIGVFWLHAGVPGVAIPSLISRVFSAAVITILCFQGKNTVCYVRKWVFKVEGYLQKKILGIAVPNGVESGVFQLAKVALSSMVAVFGTYQIAANGVAQTVWSLAALAGVSMGPVYITVIGQCMGAKKTEQAEYYFRYLTKLTIGFAICWNVFIFALTPPLLHFYTISQEAKQMTIWLVLIHNIFNAVVYPLADPLGKGLRATGDVKFTTAVSLFTTIVIRLVFSYIFAILLDMGVIGIAWAMCLDWTVRGVIFWCRFRQGNWKNLRII